MNSDYRQNAIKNLQEYDFAKQYEYINGYDDDKDHAVEHLITGKTRIFIDDLQKFRDQRKGKFGYIYISKDGTTACIGEDKSK